MARSTSSGSGGAAGVFSCSPGAGIASSATATASHATRVLRRSIEDLLCVCEGPYAIRARPRELATSRHAARSGRHLAAEPRVSYGPATGRALVVEESRIEAPV